MKCIECEKEKAIGADGLCFNCAKWRQWEERHSEDLAEVDRLQKVGHSHHCACRQVWGDGECECDLYEKGYDPYGWMKVNKRQ